LQRAIILPNPSKLVALDISKPAVLATAKRLKQISMTTQQYCLVASASQVPLASQTVSMLTSIFSPILADEFHRLVSDQGFVVIAKPAVNHLIEMRDGLFEQIVAHDSDKFIDELAPYFELVKQTRVETTISLTAMQLQDLLTMTPYAFRAQPARREALIDRCQQAGSMRFTTDFMIYGFQKICL
jgi:23S rRNA (guanine745-N1)-methyltransferase